ncbi:hypothetical protein ACQPZJ_31730 [Actinoplanes sp. CA-054009]
MRGFGSFIAVVTLIVTVLALGRDYYEITYEPDGGGIHADFGKQPDDHERSQVEQVPRLPRPKPATVKHRPTPEAVPQETETEEPQITPAPSETTAPPSDPPSESPAPSFTDPSWEPGGETAAPAP